VETLRARITSLEAANRDTVAVLESKTTALIDSLEIASVKFLNSITERQTHDTSAPTAAPSTTPPRAAAAARGSI